MKTPGRSTVWVRSVLLLALGLPMMTAYVNCSNQLLTDDVSGTSNQTNDTGLSISPAGVTVAHGAMSQLRGVGGAKPYTYEVLSGGGSIGRDTGLYTAPNTDALVTAIVTDANGDTAYAQITVSASTTVAPGALSVTFSTNVIYAGSSTFLYGNGGTGPYTFSLASGVGTVKGAVYTAPAAGGSAVVQVTDSKGATATKSFDVTGNSTTPTGVLVYMLYNSTAEDHLLSLSKTEGTDGGYTFQKDAFKVMPTAVGYTYPLRRCITSAGKHFLAANANCEGLGTVESVIGHIYSYQVSGTVPLYRFVHLTSGDRITTINQYDAAGGQYRLEGQLGYVLPPFY